MTLWGITAGSLLFITCILQTFGYVLRLSEPKEYPEAIHTLDWIEEDDEIDPAQLLAYIHSPSEKECAIHQLSRRLLAVTKDLISYAPRAKTADKQMTTQQKLSILNSLKPEDVEALLSELAVSIPPAYNVTCGHGTQYYRTMDGSCNNLKHPCWGKADEPYQRWLPPAYDNGVDELRKKTKNGNPLPSPRQVYQWVSNPFEPNPETVYPSFSNMLVVWGQMVAHDILLTPTVTIKVWDGQKLKTEKPHCCNAKFSHPDCIPIVMNYEDSYYPRGHCMDIVRSVAYTYSPHSCSPLTLGKTREQMNQLTSFLDASIVYGVSDEEIRNLREHGGRGAKMIMDLSSGWSHPVRRNSTCKSSSNVCNKNCFLTGEKRANENPILSGMHILWAREHNRLVDLLRNKGWSEETLFHVVRKIVGAMFQHTSYKEYLPLVVGNTLADLMKLSVPTRNYKYDPSINPTLYNSFVTAAFRYGHSTVSTRHLRAGKNLENSPLLSQDYFSMDDFCNPQADPVAVLLYGQIQQKVQKVDCIFSKQLTNHLFSKQPNGIGLDLFSLNIQRGRDHGLPPYNEWRATCGLPKAKNYSDLRGTIPDYVIEKLEKVYGPGNVDEIDLYVGGVSEYPVNDGILGPTFTCILSSQFRNLKFGDRFWYENTEHPGAFTRAQIASIQKTTIASILCRNTDILEIQPKALVLESDKNPRMLCPTIVRQTDIDINLW